MGPHKEKQEGQPSASAPVLLGQIIAAHGIKGEVKVRSFASDPAALADYGVLKDEAGREYRLTVLHHKGDAVTVRVKGVTDRNEAEALARAKVKLYTTRDKLPELPDGQHYVDDLRGFTALDESGAVLATLKDVLNFGAGDIVVLEDVKGEEFMLPFKEPYAHHIDKTARTLQIFIPEGWRENKNQKKKMREEEADV
jgi:16S rRNA processing protein RimM